MKQFLIVYFLFLFCFFSFFSSGFVDSQDGFQYLAVARRIFYDHTFEMPVEEYPDENIHMSLMESSDGKIYSPTGLGYSLSLLPAVFMENLFLKAAGTAPISAFPLQNDWPVLLFASMTNSFWAALFVLSLYLFMREMKIQHNNALFLSFLFSIGTNIFVYAKHSFAHMMFVSMMTCTFLFLKRSVRTKKKRDLVLTGVSFGLVVISYNPTYLFIIPVLGMYYLTLKQFRVSFENFRRLFLDAMTALLGLLPFFSLYMWFNNIRFGNAVSTGYATGGKILPSFPPAYVILEGIWGVLLSPGKSIFIYSPILLIIVLFWHKLKKDAFPEIVAAFLLFFIYVWNIGTLLGGVDFLVWHGDSSWGPRYMLPILPLFFILIAKIFTQISKRIKTFVFFPLLLLGFFVNILSILLPYQIRFAGLQTDVFFNERNFNVYEYGNEIPRYAPAFKLSKILVRRIIKIPVTYNWGKYNLTLLDGFDYPFDFGLAVWRGMQPRSYVSFDNLDQQISKFSVQVRNHQIESVSTQSAFLTFKLNGVDISPENKTLLADSEKAFEFHLEDKDILPKDNLLEIQSQYESSTAVDLKKKQVLFLQAITIDDQHQNIQTISAPYVSQISEALFGIDYKYWGDIQTDPWEIWHMHSGIYEQTFDLWWLRPLHYWDMPKDVFLGMFIIDVAGIVYFGILTLKNEGKSENVS